MRKIIRLLIALAAVILMAISGWNLFTIYSGYREADQANNEIIDQYVHVQTIPPAPDATQAPDSETTVPVETTEPTEAPEYAPITVDFDALMEVNKYVVGWIYCPDTNINYPIVQTENNSDYLRRKLDGSYSYSGTIFLDYRCEADFLDFNSIIYGHNMQNDSMFGTLEKYEKAGYYEEHPTMYLLTPDRDFRLDVIAGLNLSSTSRLYKINHTYDSFNEFLEDIYEESDFQSAIPMDQVLQTLTLSTCSYDYEDARYILVASMTELDRPE